MRFMITSEVEAVIERLHDEGKIDAAGGAALRSVFRRGGDRDFSAAVDVIQAAASASRPARSTGSVDRDQGEEPDAWEQDAWEQHNDNPELHRMMRSPAIAAAVKGADGRPLQRLTADHIREHGPRRFIVVPNLRELIDETEKRGGD